jgi:polyhydroxybutyrate depolymerase
MRKLVKTLASKTVWILLWTVGGVFFHLQGQTTVHSFSFEGATRSYRVYVPATYTGTTAVPLVFNLHGYTSNALQQEFYSEMNAVADTAGFIVCYPDGLNNSWNSGFSGNYTGGVNDVGFISVLIDTLRANYTIDPTRVYSCGMSNGGFMSYRLACDLEARIAAIASVTGSMTSLQLNNCQSSRPLPILEIHGTDDPTVPYTTSGLAIGVDSILRYWRGINTCVAAPTYDTLPDVVQEQSTVTTQWYTGCDANVEVAHYKIENGGHTWPGASFLIPGNTTNQDIEASVEIWKFFSRFSHPNPVLTSVGTNIIMPKPTVSPIPATEQVQVSSLMPGAQLILVDVNGREMGKWLAMAEKFSIDVSDLPAGIYFLHVLANGKADSLKLLVQ